MQVKRRWGELPYYSLKYDLQTRYGEPMAKLSLDGGMTCPNRDGTLGNRGCSFCSAGGSGEFAAPGILSIADQIAYAKAHRSARSQAVSYIAYFQAFTNTYAPVEYLRKIYYEAIHQPDIRILSIATRPDCLGDEVLDLLAEINAEMPVWVELGLQTIHERTAKAIRRGYPLSVFDEAVRKLKARGIQVIVHVILGLPGETRADMLATIAYLNRCGIDGIKLQLLHVLRGTDLAEEYAAGTFETLTMEDYADLVCDCVAGLRPDIVIHRLTGDGAPDLLIAPEWSRQKMKVQNLIRHRMKVREIYQGCALNDDRDRAE